MSTIGIIYAVFAEMLNAVQIVKEEMILMRTDVSLAAMFNSALSTIDDLELIVLHLPHKERLPDESPNVQIEKMYRRYYFQFLDAIIGDISTRFEQHTRDFNTHTKLEQMLVSGEVDPNLTQNYPELDESTLGIQLKMFCHQTKCKSLKEARQAYQKMPDAVRGLFSQVYILMKMLIVCPVSSCECERSFSALRRLKTWLRNTMTQQRLNYSAVCHVHKSVLDEVDTVLLATNFVSRSDIRKNMFGNFPPIHHHSA